MAHGESILIRHPKSYIIAEVRREYKAYRAIMGEEIKIPKRSDLLKFTESELVSMHTKIYMKRLKSLEKGGIKDEKDCRKIRRDKPAEERTIEKRMGWMEKKPAEWNGDGKYNAS